MWEQSLNDPDGFWLEQAKSLSWFKEPTKSLEYTWDTKNRKIEHTWFADGELNVSYNCLDRHLGTPTENKTALIWQGEVLVLGRRTVRGSYARSSLFCRGNTNRAQYVQSTHASVQCVRTYLCGHRQLWWIARRSSIRRDGSGRDGKIRASNLAVCIGQLKVKSHLTLVESEARGRGICGRATVRRMN